MSQARHFISAILWLIVVLVMYGIHSDDIPSSELWDLWSIDKFGHFCLFMILCHLWLVALNKQTKWEHLKENSVKIVVGACLAISILLELFQGTIFASRSTEILDMVANCIGVFAGWLVFKLIYAKSICR